MYRNRRLGDFLKELRLTENRGTGLPKIRKSMEANGSPEPVFDTDDNRSFFLVELPVHAHFLPLPVTVVQQMILRFCIESKSRRELFEHVQITNQSANFKRHVLPLIEHGYLEFTIPHIPNHNRQRYQTTDNGAERVGIKHT